MQKDSWILLIQYSKSIFQCHEKLPVWAPVLCIINMQIINYEQSIEGEQDTWSYEHWKNKSRLVLYEDYHCSQVPLWTLTQRRLGQENDTPNLSRSLSISVVLHFRIYLPELRFLSLSSSAMIPRWNELTCN